MPISPLEQNTVSLGIAAAKKVVSELEPLLHQLNIIYDSSGGVKETLTQEELDSVASFSGLTKAQLDDGMYALTNGLRTTINNAYTQLVLLASRG